MAYLAAVTGREPGAIVLHTPEHEAIWGLRGATGKRAIFRCGDVLVEVVQYLDPVGQPRRADYSLTDQGILNIAFGPAPVPTTDRLTSVQRRLVRDPTVDRCTSMAEVSSI